MARQEEAEERPGEEDIHLREMGSRAKGTGRGNGEHPHRQTEEEALQTTALREEAEEAGEEEAGNRNGSIHQ